MPLPYSQNKQFIYTWRDNPDNYKRQIAINRNSIRRKRDWVKITTIFNNILLII